MIWNVHGIFIVLQIFDEEKKYSEKVFIYI